MRPNQKLALAALAGVAIGVAGAKTIHAKQAKTPPGYIIAEIAVTDPDPTLLQQYGAQVPDTLAPFNHHYVVRGGKGQALEGEPPKSIFIIAFDSVQKAREWYDSPAYAAIKPLRQKATKSRIFVAEGIAGE